MNLGTIAESAFGGAINHIKGGATGTSSNTNVRAVFRQDSFISGLLLAAPSAVLSLLLLFSSDYFHSSLVTCSLREPGEYGLNAASDYRSYRYDYSYFDYSFIQGYCYANMYDYEVNKTTGEVDKDSKESLVFIKLFPYALATFAMLAGLGQFIWEVFNRRYSSQLTLLLDGIEEGAAELISGLHLIYQAWQKSTDQVVLNHISKRRRYQSGQPNFSFHSLRSTLPNGTTTFAKPVNVARIVINEETESEIEPRVTSDTESKESICAFAAKIQDELNRYWAQMETERKFVELEDLLRSKLSSFEISGRIYLYRSISLAITAVCGAGTYYLYCHMLTSHKSYNCLLPESYWYIYSGPYGDEEQQLWKTTKCYVKSTVFWHYMSLVLFAFYVFCFFYQIVSHCYNVAKWQKNSTLVQHMPLQVNLNRITSHYMTDLHCIMALAHQNNRSREMIWAADKVISSLAKDEMYKFLPVMMEMIAWKASDKKTIVPLVNNIVNK